MNRIDELFSRKQRNVLSVFYTAGFPTLGSTIPIAMELENASVDMLEIGIPYSDPLADGPVIQQSSAVALRNGMSLHLLFEQLTTLRKHCKLPVLLMGYLNPVMQFGVENFFKKCNDTGVDGFIIPDLPLDEVEQYHSLFQKYNLHCVVLITPQTAAARIRKIEKLSSEFIYMVSSAATTGKQTGFSKEQKDYFKKISAMKLNKPVMAGFGIYDKTTFSKACQYANGAIVGSHFIRLLEKLPPHDAASQLVADLRND